jgi:hypothetical protein
MGVSGRGKEAADYLAQKVDAGSNQMKSSYKPEDYAKMTAGLKKLRSEDPVFARDEAKYEGEGVGPSSKDLYAYAHSKKMPNAKFNAAILHARKRYRAELTGLMGDKVKGAGDMMRTRDRMSSPALTAAMEKHDLHVGLTKKQGKGTIKTGINATRGGALD